MNFSETIDNASLIILTGVGKSGDVAAVGASLLRSVGLRAFFLSVEDLMHGSLGVFDRDGRADAMLIGISHSGRTQSLKDLFWIVAHDFLGVHTTLVTCNSDLRIDEGLIDADTRLMYESVPESSKHGTIPVVASMLQLAVIGNIANAFADRHSASELGRFHPEGVLGTTYREMNDGHR